LKENLRIFIIIFQSKYINILLAIKLINHSYLYIYNYSDYARIDQEDRTNVFLITFHYLLHMAECIKDFGPCRGYWQFLMERMCGMLIPLVKSQIHPYANLWNNLILNERFNHLKYKTKFYEHIFPKEQEKEWPSHRVYTSSLYKEYELYSPSKKYVLTLTELKKLKEAYSAIYGLNINQIQVIFYSIYILIFAK
jgi:hypothetical protein